MSERLHWAAENLIKTVIISNTRERCRIRRQSHGGQPWSIAPKSPHKFFRKVEGFRGAATVSGAENFPPRSERLYDEVRHLRDSACLSREAADGFGTPRQACSNVNDSRPGRTSAEVRTHLAFYCQPLAEFRQVFFS